LTRNADFLREWREATFAVIDKEIEKNHESVTEVLHGPGDGAASGDIHQDGVAVDPSGHVARGD
jgi:hypothetical protein